jgi:DNA-binding MarR family transcriptional regulator
MVSPMAQRVTAGATSAGRRTRFLDRYLPFLMVRADELISRRFHDEVRELGFTVPEWRLLATLYDGDGLTIGRLAELALLPQPTASRWVDKLVAQGLVARTEGPDDRRRTIVHITKEGRAQAASLVAAARRHQRRAVSRLAPEDVEQLAGLLRRVIAGLEDDEPEPSRGTAST